MSNYTIKEFKSWKLEDKPTFGSIVVEQRVEPVDWLQDFEPQEGMDYKGRIVDYLSRKGNTRQRFEIEEPSIQDAHIAASWAVQTALPYIPDHEDLDKLEDYARALLKRRNNIVGDILNGDI